ncbi:MAG TPA: GAF domain-containing protein [Nocardioides sp.]|nr:GAF domain-containing protein [Nocardioides sp.]
MTRPVASEQAVFELLDAAATAVLGVDATTTIRYANPRSLEVFGYAEHELVGKPVELLIPGDLAEKHVPLREEFWHRPIARSLAESPTVRGRRKDGSEFAAEVALTPMTTLDGPWVIASVLDVSLRREAEELVNQQGRTYMALARLNEAVATAPDANALFRRVCNVSVVYGGFAGAWILSRGRDSSIEVLANAGPLTSKLAMASADSPSLSHYVSAEVDQVVEQGHGFPTAVSTLMTGEPAFVDDFAAEDTAHATQAEAFGVRAAAAVPLRSRGRTVACLGLYSDRPRVFNEDLRALLLGAADTISLGLDRFVAWAELDSSLAQRNDLLQRLVDAQERERARIAADVHDESVQSLAAVDLRLGLLERRLQELAPSLVPDVVRIHETVTSVSDQLRHLLFELEPVGPGALLTDLLEEAAAHVFEPTDVDWRIDNEPDPREQDLSVTLRTQAVRIAKEAMVNAAKHAAAGIVTISVALDDEGVTVQVADDGVGIPPGVRQSPPGHRGISGMRDRAEATGGRLTIASTAPGTTVTVWLPRD